MNAHEFGPQDLGRFGKAHVFVNPKGIIGVTKRDIRDEKSTPEEPAFVVDIFVPGGPISLAYGSADEESADGVVDWCRRVIRHFHE